MALVREGRGAWPSAGYGGTLRTNLTPGPYYLYRPEMGWNGVGLAAPLRFIAGQDIPFDELAVHLGVKGIQTLLGRCEGITANPTVDGVFGPQTDRAVRQVQKLGSVTVDGVVGKNTMKTLMLLPILDTASAYTTSWEAVYGILNWEGGWDPGAVGYIDRNDLGLSQVNTHAHPMVTVEEAFDPLWAINFICGYLQNAANYLGGNVRDTVASYNLGIGGAKQWIRDGRPDRWMPSWSSFERKPNEYIDRILNAHKTK